MDIDFRGALQQSEYFCLVFVVAIAIAAANLLCSMKSRNLGKTGSIVAQRQKGTTKEDERKGGGG